jgi:hypothetical protein
MTTPPVRVERRAGQRFPYLLSLSLRQCEGSVEGVGFTQDLSSRGVFFFTDAALEEGAEIEITLRMPSEITLGESMRVRCRGHVLRVVKPVPSVLDASGLPRADAKIAEAKIGVAMRLECYEYLSDLDQTATFPRVSALHEHEHDTPSNNDRPLARYGQF